ncbi:MAG: metal-sensitive transcriptional regulator [Dehalococcoidia bacterium]|nr:metal-sensitive transcriptional regulator [Dehalococcoidia bacterium]
MESQRKTQVLNRLKSIQGHLRGVQRMVEEDQYCIDVIRQALAVQKAIEKVNAIVLENHLQTCVARALRGDDPEERERVVFELLQIYEGGTNLGLNRHIGESPAGSVAGEESSGPSQAGGACPRCGSNSSPSGGIDE